MGLSPQLAAVLLCLLACTGNCTHRCDSEVSKALEENIHILNQVTQRETPCTEMVVPDVLSATKNATEKELICWAYKVLLKFYSPHEMTPCLKNNPEVLNELKKLVRSTSSLSPLRSCTVNEASHTTLKDFLGSLKRIMQKKYWECENSVF